MTVHVESMPRGLCIVLSTVSDSTFTYRSRLSPMATTKTPKGKATTKGAFLKSFRISLC